MQHLFNLILLQNSKNVSSAIQKKRPVFFLAQTILRAFPQEKTSFALLGHFGLSGLLRDLAFVVQAFRPRSKHQGSDSRNSPCPKHSQRFQYNGPCLHHMYCSIHHQSSGFLAWCYGWLGLHTPNMAGSLDYSQSLSVARDCERTNGVPKSWECRERARFGTLLWSGQKFASNVNHL